MPTPKQMDKMIAAVDMNAAAARGMAPDYDLPPNIGRRC